MFPTSGELNMLLRSLALPEGSVVDGSRFLPDIIYLKDNNINK